MSLQVWLPLNGDLHNQGLNNLLFNKTNNVTINTSGKIGECYSFSGSSSYIYSNTSCSFSTTVSIAGWVKIDTNSSNGYLFGISGDSSSLFGFYYRSNNLYLYLNGDDITTQSITSYLNSWHHYTCTYNGTTAKLYIDGQLKKTVSSSLSTFGNVNQYIYLGARKGNSNLCFTGDLNDVRIYDHCLSGKEVEELAKGLVLHYKLDNNGMGGENLYKGTYDFSGSWGNNSNWTTASEKYNSFVVKQKSSVWGGLYQNINCVQNDIFTISFWAKIDSGGVLQSVHRSSLGNVTTGLTLLGGNFSSGNTWVLASQNGTEWKRYWATVKITGSDITYLQWRIENSVADKNLYICGFKLEKGSVMTAWSPSPSDTIYPTSFKTTIYDSSGYTRNGTIVGNLTAAAGSPRYGVATHLESSSPTTNNNTGLTYIQSSLGLTTPTQMSVCWWGHPESGYGGTSNHAAWCTSASSGDPSDYNQTAFHHRDAKFDICLNSASSTSLSLTFNNYTLNEWHYYCVTYDGKIAILYKDGIETNRSTISSTEAPLKTFAKIVIGFSKAGGVWRKTLGSYSDFRVYVTALTAAQVSELYNTSGAIDSSGNVYARELVE